MRFSEIIQRQKDHFRSGATRPEAFRRARLLALDSALERHEPALLAALQKDLGKGPHEAYATEIGVLRNEIRHALRHLRRWMQPESRRSPRMAWPAKSCILRDPYGVALIIGPWNYPLQLLLAPVIGAIAAGNCAVLKPSEFAPATAAAVETLVRESFAPEFLTTICGDADTARALLAESWDKIFFTGGTAIGRAVMAAAAAHLTPVTLELGGKCPCIVLADAPLETTARRIAWGKFLNAGQTCVAPDHVWVDRRIARELIEAIRQAIVEFYGENPQLSPDYGRIINARHHDRLKAYLTDGVPATGGSHDVSDLYIAPTVLTKVALDSPVMHDEIFGPILPILEFSDPEEVLDTLAGRPKPLALYLFTRRDAEVDRIVARTHSGSVCVNDTVVQIVGTDLPFGGVGDSGFGSYHGQASFECFSHPRVVMKRGFTRLPDFRYPPVTVPFNWLKRMMRHFS